jgi:hypothetical protein
MLGDQPAIIPSIEGSAIATGFNTIWIDRVDPFWKGFSGQVMSIRSGRPRSHTSPTVSSSTSLARSHPLEIGAQS